jgi:hypothetical protein
MGTKKHLPLLQIFGSKKCVGVDTRNGALDPNHRGKHYSGVDTKTCQEGSEWTIIWKGILDAFPLIGKWLIWTIENGVKVLIGKDPWIWSQNNHHLPNHLDRNLNRGGFYYLNQIMTRD